MSLYMKKLGERAKKASLFLSTQDVKKRNLVLRKFANYLKFNKKLILKENQKDLRYAKFNNIDNHLIERLSLNEKKIHDMATAVEKIIKFKDPIGKIQKSWKRPNGLKIKKITIPIGIIGIIYESRPNVTSDVCALCFKSGNVAILRGGSDAFNSNKIIIKFFKKALKNYKFNKNCVQLIGNKNKKLVKYFLSKMNTYLDVIIPRGGINLIKTVKKLARVPVIGHLQGICHVYVDKDANLSTAIKVVVNSKMRKTSVCGAAETLLIDKKCLSTHCYPILNLLERLGCKIIGDKQIRSIFSKKIQIAKEKDWKTEYLKPIISVKCVDGVKEAIEHINRYGTSHTDSIITKNFNTAKIFQSKVKSAIAIHNASTQFADGGEFGFGAEVGISTNKLHPRGPVGLAQLTTYKYILIGKGQIRS